MNLRSWFSCLAGSLVVVAACKSADSPIIVDRCFILVAEVTPADPHLRVGDTLTMHATFFPNVSGDCLPPDTTAAGLRWISADTARVAIDSVSGRLTARRPGSAQIMLVPAAGGGVLGTTFATVLGATERL